VAAEAGFDKSTFKIIINPPFSIFCNSKRLGKKLTVYFAYGRLFPFIMPGVKDP
jgi:hypothetical protein